MLRTLVLSAFVLGLAGIPAHAADTPDPTGLWLTQNQRSAIRIDRCGESICGKVAWIIKDGMQTDSKNPDAALRARPMCGVPILWGFKHNPKNAKVWEDGKIYKADDGDTYKATVSVVDANTLNLRGYMGLPLFGKTQHWKRVSEKDYPACK
jgi:uncharacterized protein (DUF2147 family)